MNKTLTKDEKTLKVLSNLANALSKETGEYWTVVKYKGLWDNYHWMLTKEFN
jgi:hypothetical protein